MKATLTTLSVLLALSLPAHALQAGPVNDNFINATVYSGMEQTSNNTTATAEPGEVTHNPGVTLKPAHSVWWRYTPPLAGIYSIDTVNSDFDTVLSVYTGTSVSRLTRVGYNDDADGKTTSSIRLFLQKGVTYRIAVDGYGSVASGNIKLHLSLIHYLAVRTYQGYVDTGDKQVAGTGLLSLTTATTGAVTGRLVMGGHAYPFTGAVDDTGVLLASVARPGLMPVSINGYYLTAGFLLSDGVQGGCNSGNLTCTLRIDGLTTNTTAYVAAPGDPALAPYFPAAAPYTAGNPCPRAGRYTFVLAGPGNTGFAAAAVSVGITGVCTGAGHLGDGTAFSFTAPLLDNAGSGLTGVGTAGTFVFHQGLYAGGGHVTVRPIFDASQAPATLGGSGYWVRPAPPAGTVLLPAGIAATVYVYGSRYTPPAPGNRMDASFNPSGALTFRVLNTNYPSPNEGVTLSTANTFTYAPPNANLVRLVASPATGFVTGSVKLTGTPAAGPVVAVLVSHTALTTGFYGYMPAVSGYGLVFITP